MDPKIYAAIIAGAFGAMLSPLITYYFLNRGTRRKPKLEKRPEIYSDLLKFLLSGPDSGVDKQELILSLMLFGKDEVLIQARKAIEKMEKGKDFDQDYVNLVCAIRDNLGMHNEFSSETILRLRDLAARN